MNIICNICRQQFFITTKAPQSVWPFLLPLSAPGIQNRDTKETRAPRRLEEHSQNKHSKPMADCFPNFGKA
jgi:hypothetical protein